MGGKWRLRQPEYGQRLGQTGLVRNLDHQLGEILDILDNDKEEGEDD